MAEQVIRALEALYHGEPSVKDQANKWLETWQQSTEAWSIADSILHNNTSGLDVQYFCAQTLRTKVQRDFEELPPEAVISLRESLINLLFRFSKGAPPVRTQLCLAVAAMAVHLPSQQWDGSSVIRWLLQRCQSVPQDVALPCLLEMLIVLPQEATSHKVAARPERRRTFLAELQQQAPEALQVLAGSADSNAGGSRSLVLTAFGSWLRLTEGRGIDGSLAQHPLVGAALQGLQDSSTFDAAVEAVCELVWVCVDPATSTPNPAMMGLTRSIVQAVMALRPRFAVAAQKLAAEKEGRDLGDDVQDAFDDDLDTAKGMARLFAEVGEAFIQLISSASAEVAAPTEALLEVAAFPDDAICAICFNFWHKLARQLVLEFNVGGGGSGMTVDQASAEQQRRTAFFAPAFERLVRLVRGRVRFPDHYDQLGSEEKKDFRRSRQDVCDSLSDATLVLGPQRMMALLLQPLQEASSKPGAPLDWRSAEAALHCLRALHKRPPPPGDEQLQQLLRFLPSLPAAPGQLRYSCCMLLAAYADWLGDSLEVGAGGALLQPLLQMALAALETPSAAGAAAEAIRALCAHCGRHMAGCLQHLLLLHNSTCSSAGQLAAAAPAAGQPTAPRLVEEDAELLLEGLAGAMCAALPEAQLLGGLGAVLQPLLDPLAAQLQQMPPASPATGQPASLDALRACFPLIARTTVVLRSTRSQQVAADLLARTWPVLALGFSRAGAHDAGCERLGKCLKHGIKAAGKRCSPLLPHLLEALPVLFQQTRHSCFLYVVSELVKTFGDEAAYDVSMGPIVKGLLAEACAGLAALQQFNSQPDFADDTFLLAHRALHYCPRLVVAQPLVGQLWDSALAGLLVQHREACCSVLAFITRLVEPELQQQLQQQAASELQLLLAAQAPSLMRLLLAAVAGALPSARLPEVCDALCGLLRHPAARGSALLVETLQLLPDAAAGAGEKDVLVSSAGVLVSSGSRRDERLVERALEELSDVCRRTARSRRLAAAALLPAALAAAVEQQ